MKKKYVKPESETIQFESTHLMNSSGKGKPGHGWGDGGHTGPPGQNKTKSLNGWEDDEDDDTGWDIDIEC